MVTGWVVRLQIISLVKKSILICNFAHPTTADLTDQSHGLCKSSKGVQKNTLPMLRIFHKFRVPIISQSCNDPSFKSTPI